MREGLALVLPIGVQTLGTGKRQLKRQEIRSHDEVMVIDIQLPMENTITHLLFDFS